MSSVLDFFRSIGAFLLSLAGGWNASLSVLTAVMALDYLSGIFAAILGKSPNTPGGKLDSSAGFRGLLKKALIFMMVLVAAQVDKAVEGTFVRAATVWFYLVNESISVLENAGLAGVPLPGKLKGVLEKLKEAPPA